MNISPNQLLANHPIISDQISRPALQALLEQLEKVLATGPAGQPLVPGDIVEFGCYIGTTSLFIRRLLDAQAATDTSSDRQFHVYDSFEGLPPKTAADQSGAGTQFKAGELKVTKKQFMQEFHKAHLRAPFVHKGWFSNLTPADVPQQIAIAFLDGDFYESIRDSLALVLPRMQPGGVIVVDDYAREALPGAARAVHELLPRAEVRTIHNLGIIQIGSPTK